MSLSLKVARSMLVLVLFIVPLIFRAAATPDDNAASVLKLLSNLRGVQYRFASTSADQKSEFVLTLRVLGEEKVGDQPAWKVLSKIEGDEFMEYLIWVSKSTGEVLRAKIGSEEYTGESAKEVAEPGLSMWLYLLSEFAGAWKPENIENTLNYPFWRVAFLGTEEVSIGPTKLLVYKWRYESLPNAPENVRGEVWISPTGMGMITARAYAESPGERVSVTLELKSLELTSAQPLPRITVKASIDKVTVRLGESLSFSAVVKNEGSAIGFYNLTVSVNGALAKSWLLVLKPGEISSIVDDIQLSKEGENTVTVGGNAFKVLVRRTAPAAFAVSDLKANPSTVKVGETVKVTVTVKNTGNEKDTANLALKVNGVITDTQLVTLAPGESALVTFQYRPTELGEQVITVDGQSCSVQVTQRDVPAGDIFSVPLLPLAAAAAVTLIVVGALMMRLVGRKRTPPPPPPTAP